MSWRFTIGIFLLLLSSYSCNNSSANDTVINQIELATSYDQINSIIAFANCEGPNGAYTTLVHSHQDGYAYFHQEYARDSSTFTVVLPDSKTGFQLDKNKEIQDSLTLPIQEIIRSHEFHKMSCFPKQYYTDIKFINTQSFNDQDCEYYSALDQLGHPTKIYYSRKEKLIAGLEIKNPMDTFENIQIINKKWMESDYGKLVEELEIIQAAKDTFRFIFDSVTINHPQFTKITIPSPN